MSIVGYGPLERIDGPLPSPPVYGLLQAAAAPAAGVTIVPDVDSQGIERWMNGVEVFPYPAGPAVAWNACAPGTFFIPKDDGAADVANPQFGAFTVYLAERCKTYKVWDDAQFKQRAMIAFEAIESAAVAREFMSGRAMPLNPHLADGNGAFPNGATPTSPQNALALLEGEIAKSGQLGVIHMSPQMINVLANYHVLDAKTGVQRTMSGNVIVPDPGYGIDVASGTPVNPTGKTGAGGTKEWIYATGTLEVRRTELFVTPDTAAEAIDRGTGRGAEVGRPNTYIYRAERYYLIDWDTQVQAAVLADRCSTTC